MASKYLCREDAPFGDEIWAKIDDIVMSIARSQLTGRKLLDIEGPFGLSLKSVPLVDIPIHENDVKISSSEILPIPLIETDFSLGARDLASLEEAGYALDTGSIVKAAMNACTAEDDMIFKGNKDLGIHGLFTAQGVHSINLGKWEDIGAAASDVIKALTRLDDAGLHGPYMLALSPDLYNLLLRLYPQGYQVELQHVESIIGSKVIKAPGIHKGGVLMASGRQFASIVVGQDMIARFIGPQESDFEFRIVESLAPRVRVPEAVCVLKG